MAISQAFSTMNCCGPESWLARKQPKGCRQIGASILCLYADLMAAYQWHLGSAVKTMPQPVGKTGSVLLAVTIPDLAQMYMWHPL
jgi:CBS-domain-containing membrane protein